MDCIVYRACHKPIYQVASNVVCTKGLDIMRSQFFIILQIIHLYLNENYKT